MLSFKAWTEGLRQVARAPLLIVLTVIVTVAAAAPFALVLGAELRAALADQPPIALGSSEIDADWWNEFRSHADGLAATFTPTVIGFAAPLDNLSAIADGTRRPWCSSFRLPPECWRGPCCGGSRSIGSSAVPACRSAKLRPRRSGTFRASP